ncbi:MAG: DUF2244 domain-containing protein [Gammaproteobacteria bacterium]|nr:DUF2244 domain-containing protein [Gammaproteobacteria bacterium]
MNQYQLRPSASLLLATIALYVLFALGLLVFFEFDWITALFLLLALLLSYTAFSDHFEAQKVHETLVLTPLSGTVEHSIAGESRQFETFRVYTNRWSVLLKLVNHGYRRHLIFLPDRFYSKPDYLDFRYRLMHLERDVNAC